MKTNARSLKHGLFAGCALVAFAGTAHAEAAPAGAPADVASAPTEIIVTAQRRNESLQSVPMTLQALSGDTLSKLNVTTFNDLLKYTPNVTFGSNGPGQGAIFMRGLSTGFAGNQSSASIAPFPNVALYLDDQSMQFPARNADIYVADIERVEVLEGPQGTLFGGGAQAGAVRYITNKPKLNKFEGAIEGSFGGTAGGAPNAAFNAMINLPIINDTIALRAVIYDDHHGGYIDNVKSTFTRSDSDTGNAYFNNGGHALPASQQANAGQYNNNSVAKDNYNPIDYVGGRVALKWQVSPDWDLLVSETYQKVDAEGSFATYPIGSDFQKLGTLQTTTFSPSYNKDTFWNTAWTLNGNLGGGFKAIYTGAYMVRHMTEQQDYTNYSRTGGGMYYQCTGGGTGWGSGTPYCYSPVAYWDDTVRSTHQSHEVRITTPDDKRIRAIVGGYWEQFRIADQMNFDYKTIPTCTSSLVSQGIACSGLIGPVAGTTASNPGLRGANTAFGEDLQRGYDQFAFFGTVDFDILPNLTITGGTRYYNYSETETGSQFQTYAGLCYNQIGSCLSGGSGNVSIDGRNLHVRYTGFKSKGEITWKPAPHTLVYALFSQGFRPGGFNRAEKLILPDPANPTVAQLNRPGGWAPDNLTNWEIGLKTDLFDHKVQLNLSGYYMVWENVQFGFFNPAGGFGNTSFVTNGPNYHIKGGEVQIVARPMSGLTVQGSATYNDSSQSNSPCLISNVAASSTYGKCITQYYKGGSVVNVQSPYGSQGGTTPFSPHFQGNARFRYDFPQKGSMNWFVSGGISYTGPMYNQPSTYPSGEGVAVPGTTLLRYRQHGYSLLDASFGFVRDNWTVTVFGENLTNSHASTFTSSAQFIKSEVPVRPLIYGVKVGTKF
ncbi:TonB-dependent receptor [Novosphingobium nitrogenifigens DSM 19370]|uniref:TonB-dependent receptor n=1 Tax=Novosphingobium nitrogenifigens DSM 19370 TaxID=983920 RepID=F1Z9V2_9SPHN|nr:TonB-dependent receptor [Novosphingobium nitrogenifigens]EGD58640.1 TonB-dependent receptor [Novosphingobium nitrogenifigens DSM 19370]